MKPRPRLGPWFFAWSAMIPIALLRAGTLSESDTFWGIRTGYLIVDAHALPVSDSFSWTAFGQPWTLHSWLFNVLLSGADAVGGLMAVAGIAAAVVLLIAALQLRLARRMGARPWMAAALLVAASPLYLEWISARPQLVDYLGAMLLVLLFKRSQLTDEPAVVIIWIGLLMVVWTNLHSGSLLGLAMVLAFAVVSLVLSRDRYRQVVAWMAIVPAALGTLLNPYGLGLFQQPAAVAGSSTQLIDEWQRANPADPTTLLSLAIGLLALVFAMRRNDLAFTAGLSTSFIAALFVVQALPVLVLLAIPMLAAAASQSRARLFVQRHRVIFLPPAIIGMVAVTLVALPSATHIGRPNPDLYPTALVARIPAGCALLNPYLLGGYVIMARPDVRVSLDSRNDIYGTDLLTRATLGLDGQLPLTQAVTSAQCALIPSASGLAAQLRGSTAWKADGHEGPYALFVRQ